MNIPLLNPDFLNIHPNDWGTENTSLFLYSIIKTQRPFKLLEIGAGYSTFFIAQALRDIKNEIQNTENKYKTNDKLWFKDYNPILNVVENENADITSLSKIQNTLLKLELHPYVKISKQDYSKIKDNVFYDFIWWDCSAGENMPYFFKKFLNILVKGGVLIIHSTLTNHWGRLFLTELKLAISKGVYSDLELISFFEPHKTHQNSFTVIKKPLNYPIYSNYA